MNAHPLPPARWPLAIPPQWRRTVIALVAGGSGLVLALLAAAPTPALASAAATDPAPAGTASARPPRTTEAAKPPAKAQAHKSGGKTEAAKSRTKAETTKSRTKGEDGKARTRAETAETPRTRTTEAAKHKARRPSVGHAANPAPAPAATLSDPKATATTTAFEHGPGVLGMSLRTLRQEQIKEYVSEPVAMVALALDDLRFAPVNKGTHVEVNLAERVPFEGRGDKVSPKARRPLDVLARILTDNPQTRIEVRVHTDDTGDAGYNLSQSQRAADAIRAYLMAKGVAGERIGAVGRGGQDPLPASGKGASPRQARYRNRRVELLIAPWSPEPATPTAGPVGAGQPQEAQPSTSNRPMLVK